MNDENLLHGKNLTGWFSGHHSQECTNQEQEVTNINNLTTILNYPKLPTYSWKFALISN